MSSGLCILGSVRILFIIPQPFIISSLAKFLIDLEHTMQTSPCNEYPLTPHFYIVKLGFTGVYIIFLFLL